MKRRHYCPHCKADLTTRGSRVQEINVALTRLSDVRCTNCGGTWTANYDRQTAEPFDNIMKGLDEAARYLRGDDVPGIKVTTINDSHNPRRIEPTDANLDS